MQNNYFVLQVCFEIVMRNQACCAGSPSLERLLFFFFVPYDHRVAAEFWFALTSCLAVAWSMLWLQMAPLCSAMCTFMEHLAWPAQTEEHFSMTQGAVLLNEIILFFLSPPSLNLQCVGDRCGLCHLSRSSVCSGYIWRRWCRQPGGCPGDSSRPRVSPSCLLVCFGSLNRCLWSVSTDFQQWRDWGTRDIVQECHKSKNDWKENRSVWRLWGDPLRMLRFTFELSHPSYIMSYSFTFYFLRSVVSPAGISARKYLSLWRPLLFIIYIP